MRLLVLTRYGRLGASSRLRNYQYLPWLAQQGIAATISPLFDDAALALRYRRGRYSVAALTTAYAERVLRLLKAAAFDAMWIEKEALPWLPASLELALLRRVPYALEFDDAVFHHYDQHPSQLVRRLLGNRVDRLIAKAALVIVGSPYLAQRARDAGARRIELVPTVVDLDRYPLPPPRRDGGAPRLVWIGSPSTCHFLQALEVPLKRLALTDDFVLRVIGADEIPFRGIRTESVPWSEASEAAAIGSADIGLMPLPNDAWARGKCGYKLIQYMACGLPTVASRVGANESIVDAGRSGYLVDDAPGWVSSLKTLLRDPALRQQMGVIGRHRVEERYCLARTGPWVARLLASLADA